MTRFRSLTLAVSFAATWCYGQSSAPADAKVVGHGSIPVVLKKSLDSSKLKEGDVVEVETSAPFKLADGTMVAKGTKVEGHVTEAKARSKGDSESDLAITFDKVDLGGKPLSVKGLVQAVFPPEDQTDPGMPVNSGMQKGTGGLGSSAGMPTPGYQPGNIKTGSNTEAAPGKTEQAANPKSMGVQGMHDLQLSPDTGVLSSSKGKQVKLGQAVRMNVHVDILE